MSNSSAHMTAFRQLVKSVKFQKSFINKSTEVQRTMLLSLKTSNYFLNQTENTFF